MFCIGLAVFSVQAQDSILVEKITIPKIKFKQSRDPYTLAKTLTEGKSTDKEKFDAIYAWVVNNISYDQRRYNSGRAFSKKKANKILRKRKGICTDYAYLMDTLCSVAGLKNQTVTGYVKEVIFDVNDTLFFDNHAWNAVWLDDSWFLYDATWSAGYSSYEYTRFGKWRLKVLENLQAKTKLKQKTIKIEFKGDRICEIPDSMNQFTVEVKALPLVPRLLKRMFLFFPFKLKEVEQNVVNQDYYLTNPDVFALTHFPNDPTWSLTSSINNVAEFSADSTYYYGIDSLMDNQTRVKTRCVQCDKTYSLKGIAEQNEIIKQNEVNNPKNHFLPSIANLTISQLYFDQMLHELDSTQRMALFDSTLFYIELSRKGFRESSRDNRKDSKYHTKKNKAKRKIVVQENKSHRKITRDVLTQTTRRHIKIKSIANKSKMYDRRNRKDVSKFKKAVYRPANARKLKEEQLEALNNDLKRLTKESDSLSVLIDQEQTELLENSTTLWRNLQRDLNYLDPLVFSFWVDGLMRVRYQMDDYDRLVKENRDSINYNEEQFYTVVKNEIWALSDTTYAQFMNLNRLIKNRNSTDRKVAKILVKLKSGGQFTNEELVKYEESKSGQMKNDICWNQYNRVLLNKLVPEYKFFYDNTKWLYRYVHHNDKYEQQRFTIINRHISKNNRRVNDAITKNTKILTILKNKLYQDRKVYLKKLEAK